MINSLPDSFLQAGLGRQIGTLRTRLNETAMEMVTGRRQNATEATRGHNAALLEAQRIIDSAEPERARLTVLGGRYRTAAAALRSIHELTESAALQAQAGGDASRGTHADRFAALDARTALSGVVASLEARFGGRSVFGGTLGTGDVLASAEVLLADAEALIASAGVTDAAGVESVIDGYLGAGGGFETTIYTGGAGADAPELSGGQRLAVIEAADSDTFRSLFKGLLMASLNEHVDLSERQDFLRDAGSIIAGARDEVVAEEASVGLALSAIEREEGRQERLVFGAESTMDAILGRDPYEAASETQDLETRLQAAYTVTGRVSSLRLTNYLR